MRAQQVAARLVEETAQRRAARVLHGSVARRRDSSGCPLCAYGATLTDWRPAAAWIVVENCPCQGYFVWASIIARVRALPFKDRHDLSHRIRAFRMRHEVWLATTDGTIDGPLSVRTERPDRPT